MHTLSSIQAARAIYIDFESLKTDPPHPAILGVLVGSGGEDIEQLILDSQLAPAEAANRTRTRVTSASDAVEVILNLARINDSPIVGWSNFDRDRLVQIRPDLAAEITGRYANALQIVRRWRQRVHPGFKIERADQFSPRHTLDKYARLARYEHVPILEGGTPAKWIRHTQRQLEANEGRYRRITPEAKRDWHRLLEYNAHDLLALRHIVLTATKEFELWRAYERTRFCVEDGKRRICFMAGSRSSKLEALLECRGAWSWAFITASNPRSQSLPAAENARRHEQLIGAVAALQLDALPGEGIGEDTSWTAERSMLIFNVSRGKAVNLGRQFGQLAIVFGRRGEASMLVPTA